MLEDQATIEKAGKLIAELSGKKRCFVTKPIEQMGCDKEAHAYNIQKVIAEYFWLSASSLRPRTTKNNWLVMA